MPNQDLKRSMPAIVAVMLLTSLIFATALSAAEPAKVPRSEAVEAAVQRIVAAVGGEEKLLTLFSMKESLIGNPDGIKTGRERSFVVEPPGYWWQGKKDREGEPAKYLVWAWTLGAFTNRNRTCACCQK